MRIACYKSKCIIICSRSPGSLTLLLPNPDAKFQRARPNEIDLGSLSNNRIANPAPIDRRSSSNLDIVFACNEAKLRHLEMPGCLHDETKSVLANVTTRMNDDAIANDRVRYRTSWADRTLLSNSNVWPNHAVGADQRSGADSSPRPYDRTGIDRRANCELSGAMDRCARRDAVRFEKRRGTQCVRIEFASHTKHL